MSDENIYIKMGLQDSNFQSGMKRVNSELKNLKSVHKLAGAGVKDFGKSLDGLKQNSEYLGKALDLQKQKVEKYRDRMKKSSETLDKNKQKHEELKQKLGTVQSAYDDSTKATGKNSEQSRELKTELKNLQKELSQNEEKLRSGANTTTNYSTQVNKAEAELRELEAQLSATNRELATQESSLYKAGTNLESAGERAQLVGGKMKSAGSALTMGLTVPLVGLGTAASIVGMNYEETMSKVSAITGSTGADMEKMKKLARDLGSSTKYSATQAGEAMTYMGMAGYDTTQIYDALPDVLNLATAAQEDLGLTSDIVTDAMTSFGLEAKDTGRFADVLAQTSRKANTGVALMSGTFQQVAPLAGALGFSIEDTAVAIGLMANNGIKGEKSGTALKNILTNMSKPTKKMAASMEELGLTMVDSEGQMKPLNEILGELRGSFGNLSENQKAQHAATIAGKEGMAGLLSIISASEEDFAGLTSDINNSTGAAQEMADVMGDNAKGGIAEMKSALEETGIIVFESLAPAITEVTDVIKDAATAFKELPEETQENIIKFGLFVAATGPVLAGLGTLVTVGGTASTVVSGLTKAFAGISGTGAASAIGGVTTAASTATGTAGIGGLTTSIGGLATGIGAAALPIAAGMAIIAGGAYLAKEAYEDHLEETIPQMGLFRDEVVNTSKVVTESYGSWAESYEVVEQTVNKISEKTQEQLGTYLTLEDEAIRSAERLMSGVDERTEEGLQVVTGKYTLMKDSVVATMVEREESEIDTLKRLFAATDTIEAEKEQAMLERLQGSNDDRKQVMENLHEELLTIEQRAFENSGIYLEQDEARRLEILERMKTQAVEVMTQSEVEQRIIMERLGHYTDQITSQQADTIIQNAQKAHTGRISEAEAEYNEAVGVAIRMRDELGEISAEEAQAMIDAAETKRAGTVKKADEMATETITKMQSMGVTTSSEMSKTSSDFIGKVDEMKTSWGWNPETKTFGYRNDGLDTVNKGITDIKQRWENLRPTSKVFSMLFKRSYQTSGTSFSTAEGNGYGPLISKLPGENWTGNLNFKGGLSYVAEMGRELLAYPDGTAEITGDKTELRNLPAGTRIFNNPDTEKMLRKKKGIDIPGFATGNTSFVDVSGEQINLFRKINLLLDELKNSVKINRIQGVSNEATSKTFSDLKIENTFKIASMIIREEADINKIAKALSKEQEKLNRAGGRVIYEY